jgi:hypothetical protein
VTEQEENELLCEKLLGWVRFPTNIAGAVPQWWKFADGSAKATPRFLDGDSMLLLLEALHKRSVIIHLQAMDTDPDDFFCGGFTLHSHSDYLFEAHGTTYPAAVRAAALAYVRALQ